MIEDQFYWVSCNKFQPIHVSSSSTIMKLHYAVLIIFRVCNIQAENHQTVMDKFYLNPGIPALTVREGTKVTLRCPKSSRTHDLYINFVYTDTLGEAFVTLIDPFNMTDVSSKYSFNETDENTYAFTINSISRDDEGSYIFVQGRDIRSRVTTVIYSPSSSSPRCSSNYKSPIIFYDEITDDFVFTCSTEIGKPPVITKIYVNEQEVASTDLEITNETGTKTENIFTTYSFFRQFNDTLQNSEFVCIVTQQLPSPYDDYQGSCSFGPLHLLPGFSLSVSPSNVTVRETSNVTLTCTSNVTGVEITWNNIPSETYNVAKYNRSSVLTILSLKPASYETIFVECIGSYGSRTVTANAALFFTFNAEEPEDGKSKENANGTFTPFFVAGSLIVPVLLAPLAFFIIRNKRKRKEAHIETSLDNNVLENTCTINRQNHTLAVTEESNMNNGNNTAIYQKDDSMCDNIIYEPASYGNMNELVEEEKIKTFENRDPRFELGNFVFGDEHIICENVVYQSVSNVKKEGRNTADLAF